MAMLRIAMILLFCGLAGSAAAQTTFDAVGGYLGPSSPTQIPGYFGGNIGGSDDWSRCQRSDRDNVQRAVRSCGRVIGERISLTHTAGAHYYRARHHDDLGDNENAQRDLARALEVFGQVISSRRDATAYMNRASVYEYMERNDEALADYTRALELDSQLARPNYRRGVIFFRNADFPSAIAEYDEAARKYPEYAYYQATRCEARAAGRVDLETARAACDEAIRLDAEDSYVHFSRGFLRFVEGDIQGALSDFETAIALDDECAPAL